jgi:nucleolar protein 14
VDGYFQFIPKLLAFSPDIMLNLKLRRFGESDADLSLEDKMFLRFQKERVKKARNTSLFNLDSSENEVLTHKGQALGESNMADTDWRSDSDDEQGGLGKEVVNSLHFGGGMVEKKQFAAAATTGILGDGSKAADGEFDGDGHKKNNRLDALQEIVMKSKMFKAQKKEAKEEQESERERLDRAFQDLISESQVKFRPTKRDHSEDVEEIGEQDSLMTEYDRSLRSMTFDTKAKPTDRTKSAEVIFNKKYIHVAF